MAIKQLLGHTLQLPVLIDNGANTAVLAEHLFWMGKDFLNIAYFNCSATKLPSLYGVNKKSDLF